MSGAGGMGRYISSKACLHAATDIPTISAVSSALLNLCSVLPKSPTNPSLLRRVQRGRRRGKCDTGSSRILFDRACASGTSSFGSSGGCLIWQHSGCSVSHVIHKVSIDIRAHFPQRPRGPRGQSFADGAGVRPQSRLEISDLVLGHRCQGPTLEDRDRQLFLP